MNVLIIEDEIKTAKDLKDLIEGVDSDIRVIDILNSVSDAIDWFKTHDAPDLILSDIQLGDGLSFDIYKTVQVNAPIIFCTAYNEYAIQAFEANSIDYLLKPIDDEMLAQSMMKYKRFKSIFDTQRDAYQEKLVRLAGDMDAKYKQSILVYFREKIIPVKISDIQFIYAVNGLVYIYLNQNQSYSTQHTVDQLETMLNPSQFFKANRQFIINRDIIQNVEHYFSRRLFVKTSCEVPEKIIVSRLKAHDFLEWIES
jgi:two-component system response regulator LytT